MKFRRPCDAVSPEIWAMPIGPCRFSAPIAPVRMLRQPVQRLDDDRARALDPVAERGPGRRRLGRRQVERRAGDADHHPPLEAALAVVGVALLRRDARASGVSPSRQTVSGMVWPSEASTTVRRSSNEASSLPVRGQDHVAGPEPGLARRRQRLDALHQRRHRVGDRQLHLAAVALDADLHRRGRGQRHRDAVEVVEARHRLAVDRQQHVARPQRLLDDGQRLDGRRPSAARSARPARSRCRRRRRSSAGS